MLMCQSGSAVKEMLFIYVYTMQAVSNETFPWTKETSLPVPNNMRHWKVRLFPPPNIQALQYRATDIYKAANSQKSL